MHMNKIVYRENIDHTIIYIYIFIIYIYIHTQTAVLLHIEYTLV
jgi:hypothetical protein